MMDEMKACYNSINRGACLIKQSENGIDGMATTTAVLA